MNIIFFGSDNFAVPSLEALISSGHKIACVVTQPDRKKGRGLHLEATAVKVFAKKANLEILEPSDINSAAAVKFLRNIEADLFVVLAYGQILSGEVLSLPKLLAVNIHGSLLPKYRGAAPINRAIINGDKITGVSSTKMVEEMDAGPVIVQEAININSDDTASSLSDKMSGHAARLLIKTIFQIESNSYELAPQDKLKASFAPKLKKEDGLINWSAPAQKIHSLIRGCYAWPGAFTYYKGKLLKICTASVFLAIEKEGASLVPGEIIRVLKDGIVVSCGKGDLIIEELQLEGKRRMPASDFTAGHKIRSGEKLGFLL